MWINNPISGGVAVYPVNDLEITTIENGVWTAYSGDAADLTVWTDYDGINVTALGDGLFKGNQTIRSFYPHHCGWFTAIGAEAFADSSVETVELFGSITTIGEEAFRNCVGLTELTLPESLTAIGERAFMGCTGLTELTLPASLTSIGEGALDGCERLARLNVLCDPAILPEGLLDECFAHTEICAAPDATDEQIARLSDLAHRPWYAPVARVGEPVNDLVFNEDGTLVIFDGEETDVGVWKAENGMAVVDTMQGSILEDGTLCMNEDGAELIFAREAAANGPDAEETAGIEPEAAVAEPEEPSDAALNEFAADRLEHKFVCINAEVSGVTVDASLLGGEYALTFHADGTADFVMIGNRFAGLPWTAVQTGAGDAWSVDYYGQALEAVLTEKGFDLNYFDAMMMHFVPED